MAYVNLAKSILENLGAMFRPVSLSLSMAAVTNIYRFLAGVDTKYYFSLLKKSTKCQVITKCLLNYAKWVKMPSKFGQMV